MKAPNFEALHIYENSRIAVREIYKLTSCGDFSKDYGLRDQIRRAAVSVISNIAEGFDRGSNTEFARFLFISKGSCAEVIAQLTVAYDLGYINEGRYIDMKNNIKKISAMTTNLIKYLKASGYNGKKHTLTKV